MIKKRILSLTLFISAFFLLPSTHALAESSQPPTYEKQKVEKLEGDEDRYQQLKKDADPRGRTEENKGNFDIDVPRGTGIEYPPAKSLNQPEPMASPPKQ